MLAVKKFDREVRTDFQIPSLPSPNGVILGKSLWLYLTRGDNAVKHSE